ncbi:histidine kinase [Pedobacter sp.]|uniref:sensor histidine kinase n=1 Tax=Pedobacter sp. TaxID=1411316 RepID=UPI00280ABCE2|nr:histidine kinase [Pedobacter sp.]
MGKLAFAQSEDVVQLNQQSGLPSNHVYDIFQDDRGFIWMATDAGLYRYDGFEYKLYASENQSSLAGSAIQQDRYGRIWYENFDGYLFYIENERLHEIKQDHPIQFLPFGLSDKYLYVIFKNGVNVYNLKTLKIEKTINIEFVYAEHAALINGHFFITDQDKVICIDPNFNLYQTSVNIDKQVGVKLIKSIKGKIAIVPRNGKYVNFYDQKLNYLSRLSINLKGLFHEIYQVENNKFWFVTSKGIEEAVFDNKEIKVSNLKWPNLSISKYLLDKNGNSWISTIGNGVLLVPKISNQQFYATGEKYTHLFKNKDAYVAVSNAGEVKLLDSQFSAIKTLLSANTSMSYLNISANKKSLMYADNKGLHLYSAGKTKDINVAVKEAVQLDEKYYLVAVSGFYGMMKNPFATQKIASQWDRYFTQNVFNLEDFSAFKSYVRAKTIDYNFRTKQIVVGTNVGTFLNTLGVEQEIKYKAVPFYVKKIFWYQDVLFALTTNGDFYKITDLKHFERIELSESGIRFLKRQGNTIFLVGANLIYAYHLETGKFDKYDIDYNNNTINDFLVEGDFLVIAGEQGVVKIKYRNVGAANEDVPFYINGLYVNDAKVKSLEGLSYTQNNIRINYSFLNYGRKNGVVISYKLNNGEWISATENERDVYFRALAPGSYTVSFKLNDKVLAEKTIISIALPIWKTWWFYLLLSVVLLAVMLFYYKTKTSLYTQQIKLLNEKIQLERSLGKSVLTSIKAQMNPHFFYNALNTIQAFIFTNDKVSANNYLAKFSKLTRLVLEMSEKEIVSLSEEIDATKMYLDLEKMRFGKKIDYLIKVNGISNTEMIELPPMLVQPLIENAIKHGLLHLDKAGLVTITYSKLGECLQVEVDDNGVGRKKAAELKANKEKLHHSFAIKANQTRLDILNKGRVNSLFVLEIIDKYELGQPSGTIARLTIPLDV